MSSDNNNNISCSDSCDCHHQNSGGNSEEVQSSNHPATTTECCSGNNHCDNSTTTTKPKKNQPPKKPSKEEREAAKQQAVKGQPAIKGRRGVPVDKQTFIQSNHKQFKINLNEKIAKGDTVLVCFSGGMNSTSLANLLHNCVSPNPNWKLHFKWEYLFVDVTGALGLNSEERESVRQQVRDFCTNLDESNNIIHIRSIEDMLFDGDEQRMKDFIFRQFNTMSVHEDLISQMVKTCIYKFAVEKNFKQVLTGESANHMAINVLSEISKGRGYIVPLQIVLEDKTMNNVPSFNPETDPVITYIRPVRSFLSNELAMYNHWTGIKKYVFVKNLTTKAGARQSTINRLVEDFISMLQKDFPSTVHAILRTIEKLKVPDQNKIRCSMCGSFLSKEDLKDAKSTSEDLSLSTCCCFGCKRMLTYSNSQNTQSIGKVAITDLTSEVFIDDSFPSYIQNSYQLTRKEMKEQIAEFLLEDTE
ncbi:predicted protein [Naegleria gruberi]|uniref:Cytoplasmic tRNA 2-thiolation protein 2 n=1 Tax=Naegleria gruberi TaxID=5762 RepID=D2V0B0_NAEGR|nr:uncharacterized protein NAEGRDRAFT_62229 [Naegleria gruberi]EFC49684.1 predicted protein [Naegleria gruberi]|eukprot:XP_002682428.1 predicted protein [Naegleria gruberi strain NEG-M]